MITLLIGTQTHLAFICLYTFVYVLSLKYVHDDLARTLFEMLPSNIIHCEDCHGLPLDNRQGYQTESLLSLSNFCFICARIDCHILHPDHRVYKDDLIWVVSNVLFMAALNECLLDWRAPYCRWVAISALFSNLIYDHRTFHIAVLNPTMLGFPSLSLPCSHSLHLCLSWVSVVKNTCKFSSFIQVIPMVLWEITNTKEYLHPEKTATAQLAITSTLI